jgi:hypothetical protein
MVMAVQKHYYGYGSVIDVRENFRDSCVLGSEEEGRSGVTVVMNIYIALLKKLSLLISYVLHKVRNV